MLQKLKDHNFIKALFLICALSLYFGHFFPVDSTGWDNYLSYIFPSMRMESFVDNSIITNSCFIHYNSYALLEIDSKN